MNSKISEDEMKRVWGAFYGQIIGDALGARYEFQSAQKASQNVNADKKTGIFGLFKKSFLPMLGDGTRSMKPGQFTDDSEMALCLARSIVEEEKYDQINAACSYAYWMHTGPMTAGRTTKCALMNAFHAITGLKGEDLLKHLMEAPSDQYLNPNWRTDFSDEQKQMIFNKIQSNVREYNNQSLSNGALMRISPLAIAYRNASAAELRNLATLETQITHSNPVAWDASSVYVIALAALLKGKTKQESYNEALANAETDIVKGHLEAAKTHAIPVQLPQNITWNQGMLSFVLNPGQKPPTVTKGDDKSQGYMGVALQFAFYELLHAKNFSSGLENIITRGGDTDTNGCIAAALLGAYFGVDGIPEVWIETVRQAEPYKGCRNWERSKIPMDFFSIKDVDSLVPQLSNIKNT